MPGRYNWLGIANPRGKHFRVDDRDDGFHTTPLDVQSPRRGPRLLALVLVIGLVIAAVLVLRAVVDRPAALPPAFAVDSDQATMTGMIGPSTAADLALVLLDPDITTIVMADVPGSSDDAVYPDVGRLVRGAGLATHVPADGMIAAGGVDFFLAGATRTSEPGATFGVRSWVNEDGVQGRDLPKDDPQHDPYLEYFAEIGIPEDFYWFTLEAAPADSIHIMTAQELDEFGFST